MSTYVPRTKQQRNQLHDVPATIGKTVTLKGCGHQVSGEPEVSNPDRYWCCSQFREPLR